MIILKHLIRCLAFLIMLGNALTAAVLRVLLGEVNHYHSTFTGFVTDCLRNHPALRLTAR